MVYKKSRTRATLVGTTVFFFTLFQLFKEKNKVLSHTDSLGKWGVVESQWTKVRRPWELV